MFVSSAVLASNVEDLLKLSRNQDIDVNKLASAIQNKKIVFNEHIDAEEVITSFKDLHATDSVDASELDEIISHVISQNPDAVEKYKNGQKQVIGFFMGQIMRQLTVKADPQQVTATLGKALENC